MRSVRTFGLCLMVVFALSAVAASSASAGELLFKAVTGNIVGGSFESLGGLSVLRTVGGSSIHCKDVHDRGLFLSTTLGDVLIRFLGCTTEVFGSQIDCQNAGLSEIHLPLTTTLFHLGLAHLGGSRLPAMDILLDSGVAFKCGAANVSVTGAVIGELEWPEGTPAPLNSKLKEIQLAFREAGTGKQELTLFLMPGGGLFTQHLSSLILREEESAETSRDTLKNFKNSAGAATEIELVEP